MRNAIETQINLDWMLQLQLVQPTAQRESPHDAVRRRLPCSMSSPSSAAAVERLHAGQLRQHAGQGLAHVTAVDDHVDGTMLKQNSLR